MMKALVTGGGGFLGTRIVGLLQARGDEVTALGRNRYPHHERSQIRTIKADLRDGAAVHKACQGMDIVYHVGALAGVWGKRRDYFGTNVEGTRNVIRACQDAGVPKIVYTSTPSVVFGKDELCGVDESQPYPNRFLTNYAASKAQAERDILAANCQSLATVSLRPHLIWGPGDTQLIPRVIIRAKARRLIRVGDGENLVDITYIDNAADAHLCAGDALGFGSACSGKAYFISQGEPVSLWSWLAELLDGLKLPRVERSASTSTAYRIGAAMEMVYRIFRLQGEPPMTRFVALQLGKAHYFDITAAQRDLGYQPSVSTKEGLTRLVKSLCDEGPDSLEAA